MNIKEHLLTCISEECAEIQQAVAKAQRFGLEDGYPGAETTNKQDIYKEYIELIAVIDMCRDLGVLTQLSNTKDVYDGKIQRLKQYMEYAKERGTLTPNNER